MSTTRPRTDQFGRSFAQDTHDAFERRLEDVPEDDWSIADDIRETYTRLSAPLTTFFPLGHGEGLADTGAFHRCADQYGYVAAVIALKRVSAYAKQRNDAYWSRFGPRRPR